MSTRAPAQAADPELSTTQVQMRTIYSALKRSGAVGATRADLVAATGLSLWQVKVVATTMVRNHWIYAVQQDAAGRKTWRYATCREHWERKGR